MQRARVRSAARAAPPAAPRRRARSSMRRATATARRPSRCSRNAPIRIKPRADGTTPLHWAVHHDDVELVAAAARGRRERRRRERLRRDADVGSRRRRRTPAVLAALLEAGADVDSPNADGQTALMVVARSGNVEAARAADRARRRTSMRASSARARRALMWAAAQSQPAMVEAAARARRGSRRALHGQRVGAQGHGRAARRRT